MEVAMRIIFITLIVTVLCSLTVMSYADDKSECLGGCSNDKHSKDMYCPPAGGYTDEDHKQCMDTNATAYNDCIKSCSPAPVIPELAAPQPVVTPPPAAPQPATAAPAVPEPVAPKPASPQPDGPGAADNK
jgi:hypothetical protein